MSIGFTGSLVALVVYLRSHPPTLFVYDFLRYDVCSVCLFTTLYTLQGRIKHGANPPVPDVPRARLQQQGQQTVSTEERHLDRDAKDRQLAADFQQQLINDGWGDWAGINSSVDVPPSPVAVGGSDIELSADIG